jgi:hypothetical protein
MDEYSVFAAHFQALCHAFREPVDSNALKQYYSAFKDLTTAQVQRLFDWATQNLESSFPKIATLKRYAASQDWYRGHGAASPIDPIIVVVCPECGGSFAVKRTELSLHAQEGLSFACVNSKYWHCPTVFSARTILENETP